jgi:hypothetical protein
MHLATHRSSNTRVERRYDSAVARPVAFQKGVARPVVFEKGVARPVAFEGRWQGRWCSKGGVACLAVELAHAHDESCRVLFATYYLVSGGGGARARRLSSRVACRLDCLDVPAEA